MQSIVHLLNEVAMLGRTPRSGFAFLGTGRQSVAEHTYIVAMVGFALAKQMNKPIDYYKLLMLCLVHDLPEARTGDLNYVNKRYVFADEPKATEHIRKSSALGSELATFIDEFREEKSLESTIAHDADQLEMILVLKKEFDTGNPRAIDWLDIVAKRLKTDEAKKMAAEVRRTPFDAWWLENKDDPHWVKGK